MKVRASASRVLGKVSMAWRSCSLRGIGFAPMGSFFYFRRSPFRKSTDDRPIRWGKNRVIAFFIGYGGDRLYKRF
jgi:hypothetical protein